jgi:hypothetical protein
MMPNPTPMDDFLTAATDAALRGERDFDRIARRYGVSQADADRMVPLIRHLKVVHKAERPSEQFKRKLQRDLMGVPEYTIVERVRYLPPRVQIAAGAAVSITAALLLVGRFGWPLIRLLSGRAPMRGYNPAS